jgi:hypothetical protein
MAYYFDHQDEIDREIEDEARQSRKSLAQAADSPLRLRLRARDRA